MAPRRRLPLALALGAILLTAGASFAACADAFVPQSEIETLRILGVQVDTPYAKPGADVNLTMLYYDGSPKAFDASGKRDRTVQVLWISGCYDPDGDLYYSCFPQLAALFASAGVSSSPDAGAAGALADFGALGSFVGLGDTYRFTVPADIITRKPPAQTSDMSSNIPYGLTYVFYAVCGGTLAPVSDGVQSGGLPISCLDSNGNTLGSDDFVIGYTPIYAYDSITDRNPVIESETFNGATPANGPCSAGCPTGTACDPNGLCLPTVPHCTSEKVADCPTYNFTPLLDPTANIELDTASPPINGAVPDKVIWVSYYTSNGTISSDTKLINDATTGWQNDFSTSWSAPSGPAEARIWAVVHDNRGGTGWTWQDVIIQ